MRAILSLLAVSMAIAIGFGPLQARAANLIALSEANVSGRYSFRFSGQDLIFGNAHQIAGVGVFVANGRGLISGGRSHTTTAATFVFLDCLKKGATTVSSLTGRDT